MKTIYQIKVDNSHSSSKSCLHSPKHIQPNGLGIIKIENGYLT